MRLVEGICVGGPRNGEVMARNTRTVPVTVGTDIPWHAIQFAEASVHIGLYEWQDERIPQVGGNGHWKWTEPHETQKEHDGSTQA